MKSIRLAAVLFVVSASAALAQNEGVANFDLRMHAAAGAPPDGHSKLAFSRSALRIETELNMGARTPGRPQTGGKPPGTIRMTMLQKISEPDRLYLVNDEQQSYSVMDLAKMRAQAPAREDETWMVKRLGSDRIAGLSCEKALLTSSKGSEVEACVSSELPVSKVWIETMNRGNRTSNRWLKTMEDAGIKGFPIRMRFRSANRAKDATQMEMVLVSVERKSLPSSTFEIPAGYKESSGFDATGGSPDARKAIEDALAKMTPEQRKAYEEAMRKQHPPNR